MSEELILEGKFGQPYLLNDDDDKKLELNLNIMASGDLRERLSLINDNGIEFCIVLDISESMYDFVDESKDNEKYFEPISKIDAAIGEIESIIENARDKDILSLVAYDDDAHVVFESIRGFDKEVMFSGIKSIRSYEGNTNITAGLREAKNILTKNSNNDKLKRIIFITDGIPYGGDTEEYIIEEAKSIAENNIIIDCFGIGEDFNYNLLEKIISPSNGRTFIWKRNSEENFMYLFRKSQDVILSNVKAKLKFSKLLSVEEYYRGAPQNLYLGSSALNDDRELVINLGHVEKNQKYSYYFKLNIPGQSGYCGPLRIAEVEVEYSIPVLYGNRIRKINKNLVVDFGDNIEMVTTDGDVKNGYKIAYIKMLEQEIESAQEFNDYITIIRRYNQIMKIYKELEFSKEFEIYTNIFEEYKKKGTVSRKNANESKSYSSRAGDNGVLTQIIPKGFIRHTKRRGGI